ncbi:MAG: peptidoglycan DD-metalloendopeptidase family protein [Bacteroidales bacterium]|nr:peptidoglycan DD-metalloendopeptidase family protein [Bacteroidales bacterium]
MMFLSFLGISNNAISQNKKKTKKQLQSQQKSITKKINYTKHLLKETKNKKLSSLNELSLLHMQVNERKQLIRSYGNEISLIDNQIKTNQDDIMRLERDLKLLKKEYAQLIYQSYKSRDNFDQWMFLFASKDFYQAMRRMRYLREYNEYRRLKATEIEQTKISLQEEIALLEEQKDERLGVLVSKETETRELENDRLRKQRTINNLKKEEKNIRKQLQQQQREWNTLSKKIQKIIEDELNKTSPDGNKIPLTPAEVALGESFVSNAGKLPWPTTRANIISKYGKHRHPDMPGIIVNNSGTDFRCEKGTTVKAVFEGKVTKIFVMPRYYKVIMVKHGAYLTVYSNIKDVFVQEGQMVKLKEKLGTVWTDPNSGETILHFELRKGAVPQNPSKWLLKQK